MIRINRTEYSLFFVIAFFTAAIITYTINNFVYPNSATDRFTFGIMVTLILLVFGIFLDLLYVTVGRLNDIGLNKWLSVITFIPIIGLIFNIILMFIKSSNIKDTTVQLKNNFKINKLQTHTKEQTIITRRNRLNYTIRVIPTLIIASFLSPLMKEMLFIQAKTGNISDKLVLWSLCLLCMALIIYLLYLVIGRLKDVGWSPWNVILLFVPVAAPIMIIVLMFKKTKV